MAYATVAGPDDFSGSLANYTALNATNAGTTSISSGVVISSAALSFASDGGAANVWSGSGSFTNDQRSIASIITTHLTTDYFCGVIVRASTDTGAGRDYYGCVVEADSGGAKTTRIFKIVNGTYTSLASTTVSWNNTGDTMWLDVIGDKLTAYRNSTAITGLIDITDTALTTGKPGLIVSSGASTTIAVDNWEGGNLTGDTNVALSGSASTPGHGTQTPSFSIAL